ncbi:MAG: hypothetical protein CFH07_00449 [Alphaproteobacteria bacterium MarineAlpha3_Bin6]|jgi:hypothetical protein|nr:MAG: hypothetical protein CFH07_00449 [Alphaproteobacteria bacterium MarineAlpha3_Bin6]|tara:strand:- start:374 stop:535 length:162 start_codon:yes stop_codon:yes gene_type:complete
MRLIKRTFFAFVLLVAGWLLNFIFDTQFVFGVVSGWLMKEGYDSLARYLLNLM